MKKKKKKVKELTQVQIEMRKQTKAFIEGLFLGMAKAVGR